MVRGGNVGSLREGHHFSPGLASTGTRYGVGVTSRNHDEDKKYGRKGWRLVLRKLVRALCFLFLCFTTVLVVLVAFKVSNETPTNELEQPSMTQYVAHGTLEAEFRTLFQNPESRNHRKYVTWLTKDTFDKFLKDNQYVFIDFFSHNCAWSQRLYPIWVDFATVVHETDLSSTVAVGAVDCVDEGKICSKMGVTAFPILKWFVNGTVTVPVYQGKRSAQALLEFALKSTKVI